MGHVFRRTAAFAIAVMVLALTVNIASADGPGYKTVSQDLQNLLFGVNVGSGDDLIVADSGAGPTKLDPEDGDTSLIASLPGVTDVIQVGRREFYAITGEEDAGFYRIRNGNVTKVADILAWELANDPGQDNTVPPEDAISNPFDLAKLSGNRFLVADAAGNSILVVDKKGNIDWVAVLPHQEVSTQPLKDAVGCPAGPPDICDLPATIPADPVATTVAIGPDGAIYAGELKGFPATPGTSRVWRIDRGERHVRCGTDDEDCTQVETPPFTSIIDIQFDGRTAYVVEIDENSWLAAEEGQGVGGTVNACRSARNGGRGDDDDDGDNDRRRNNNRNGSVTWSCEEVATALPFPLAVAIDDESVYVTLAHGFEGPFEVAKLTGTSNGGGDEDEDDD